jgi:regulator of cell morphogenesis and NO signaling
MFGANSQKETALVEKFYNEYFIEVKEHLLYENEIVHPYINELYNKIQDTAYNIKITKYSVTEYKTHHNDIEEKLNDLKSLLIKYLPLKNDINLRRKLLFSLYELEYDLHIHSQIEELILVPLVAEMEKYLNKTK